MSTRARFQNSNDSKSLWNYTLSPGWSQFDAHILRLAIIRYGCGSWKDIKAHFPLKNCGQLNLQTQRLFGQQALSEFNKLHIDPNRIKEVNDKIDGFRKNTCLINTGKNMTAERRDFLKKQHRAAYGVPEDLYEQIVVPVVMDPPRPCHALVDKIGKLREMYRCVFDVQRKLIFDAKKSEGFDRKGVKKNNRNTKKSKSVSNDSVSEQKEMEKVETKGNGKPVPKLEPPPMSAVPSKSTNTNKNKNPNKKKKKTSMDIDDSDFDVDADVVVVDANNEIITQKKKKTARSAKKKKPKASAKKGSKKRKKMDNDDYVPPSSKRRRKK